jgi:glycosyltransferase involved in cell wall biosynthesis
LALAGYTSDQSSILTPWTNINGVSISLKKVTILLATYNGEKFINEQLESLASQQDVYLDVYANDDGSTDGTLEILKHWQQKGLIRSISTTNRIGATQAFLNLLRTCPLSEYVAFCDQDDIWGSRKVISMIPFARSEEPRLVVCAREFIDEEGKKSLSSKSGSVAASFANALVENIAPGNCSLINASAIKILNSYENPRVNHYDSWVYLNIVALGQCIVLPDKLVKYRIHKGNVVGLRDYRLRTKVNSIEEYFLQAKYFRENRRNNLSTHDKLVLDEFLELFVIKSPHRIVSSIIRFQVNRQKKKDGAIFKILLVWITLKSWLKLRK